MLCARGRGMLGFIMMMRWMIAGGVLGLGLLVGCGGGPRASAPVSFVNDVKPIFESRCLGCHQTGALLGRFNLETKELAFGDGEGRVFIDPGNPEGSKVYVALTLARDDAAAMPPEGHEVPDGDVEVIRRWIEQGADWPDGDAGRLVKLNP